MFPTYGSPAGQGRGNAPPMGGAGSLDGQAEEQRRILNYLSDAGRESVVYSSVQQDLRLEPRVAEAALRSLLESGKVTITRRPGVNGPDAVHLSLTSVLPDGVSAVLDVVRQSGRNGVDLPTICSTLRTAKTEVTKALQQLVMQHRIKRIQDFANKAKRKYMLFDLEPSEEVTGGTFYNEMREIDQPFVNWLRQSAVVFVAERVSVSLDEIVSFLQNALQQQIHRQGLTGGKQLSHKDAETIVLTLEHDGVLDRLCRVSTQPAQYQIAVGKNVLRSFAITRTPDMAAPGNDEQHMGDANAAHRGAPRIVVGSGRIYSESVSGGESIAAQSSRMATAAYPCVGCPLLESCSPTGLGLVKPQTCSYLNSWLNQ